ncbi:beta-ketoacyl synthase chain length factor, partial [Dokdonella sp.]|uniref:beta-ketoacyl synthase chain length factor n=1 Tax=Dokdonella sp. TaxID=2291710 RepID=UPI003C439016
PIRFHNSVHNAPAGYWTIAAQCHAPSTSISSWHTSFATALFEASVQALADDTPVLLVVYDTDSIGPLAPVAPSTRLFGAALVLSPGESGKQLLRIRHDSSPARSPQSSTLIGAFAELASANPMARGALPLLAALASGQPASLQLPAGARSVLQIEVCA